MTRSLCIHFLSAVFYISLLVGSAALAVPVLPADYSIYPHLDRIEGHEGMTYTVEAYSLWGIDFFAVGNDVSGVQIFMIIDGSAVQMGVVQALGVERDIAVKDWNLFVATGSVGLSALSVAAPESPLFVSSLDLAGEATRVDVSATHAFVACGTGGLSIVDISNTGSMWEVGVYGTNVTAVCVDGDRLGIVNDGNVEILDITVPAAPVLLGSSTSATGASFIDVVLQGDHAYGVVYNHVERLDITIPSAITLVEELPLNSPYGLYNSRLEIEGSELFVAASRYLGILEFATGNLLRESKQVGVITDAACIGGKIITAGDERLEIYNDGLHDSVTATGIFSFPDLQFVQGIMFKDIAYGLAWSPVNAIAAKEIGGDGNFLWTLDMGPEGNTVHSMVQRGSSMAVLTYDGVLKIATVSRYGAELRGTIALPDLDPPEPRNPVMAFLDDQTVIVLDGDGLPVPYNIRVVDISDPDLPVEIGYYPLTGGYASSVMTTGSLVLLTYNSRLEVFDAQNRFSLQPLAVHDMGEAGIRIYVRGSYVYSLHNGGIVPFHGVEHLDTWDFSDPVMPVLMNQLNLATANNLVFAGDWAYQESTGLILDLADPADPKPAGNFSLPNTSVSQMSQVLASTEYLLTGWFSNSQFPSAYYLAAQSGTGEISSVGDDIPEIGPELALDAVPNPFNPRVSLRFELPVATSTRLEIFDLRGRLVADLGEEYRQAGPYSVTWDGRDREDRNLPSGVYLARLVTAKSSVSRKIVLAR